MALQIARFISLLLTAVATGLVFSQVLNTRAKATLPGNIFLAIHQTLLRNYEPVIESLEIGALAATIVALALTRQPSAFLFTLAAAVSIAGIIVVWALFVRHINEQINHWRSGRLSSDWTKYRDLWATFQGLRAILAFAALIALILAVLSGNPTSALPR